jgi:hypothetical protein
MAHALATLAAVLGPQLFPDRASYQREENHRWELVDADWDLPIHEVDPHASDQ